MKDQKYEIKEKFRIWVEKMISEEPEMMEEFDKKEQRISECDAIDGCWMGR